MSTITKEWLQQAINDYESVRDELPFGLDDYQGNILAALRIALASLEAEAVGYFGRFDADDEDLIDQCSPNINGAFPLFSAPPAPVYVHDDEQCKPHPVMAVKGELGFLDHFERIISERDEDIDIGQLGCSNYEALMLAALDAFRAAMLQGGKS